MADEIGYVTLAVIPSFKGASSTLAAELNRSKVGATAGAATGKQFGTSYSKGVVATGGKGTQSLFSQAEKGAVASGLGIGRRAGASITKGLKEYAKFAGATVAGYFAVEKVKDFIGDVVSEGRQALETRKLLDAAIKSTGGVANVSADDVEKLAAAQSHLIGVDDDTIAASEVLLLRFQNVRNEVGKGNDVFNQATIEAENLSAGLNLGLSSAMRLVGKATNDPILGLTSLSRVGVQFTDDQKEQIKALVESGHALEAQKTVLDSIDQRFGGAAEALNTPVKQLSADFHNFEEELGLKVIPVINDGADGLIAFAGAANSTIGFVNDLPGPIFEVAGAYVALRLAQTLMTKVPLQAWATRTSLSLEGVRDRTFAAGLAFEAGAAQESLFVRSGRGLGALTAGLGGVARAGAGIAGITLLMANLGDQTSTSGIALHDFSTIAGDAAIGFSVGGPWGAAIGSAAGLFQAVTRDSKPATSSIETFTQTLDDNTGALTKNTRELVFNDLQKNGTFDKARDLGISLNLVTDAALNQHDAVAALNRLYADATPQSTAQAAFIKTGKAVHGAALDAGDLREQQAKLPSGLRDIIKAVGAEGGAVSASREEWQRHHEVIDLNRASYRRVSLSAAEAARTNDLLGDSLIGTNAGLGDVSVSAEDAAKQTRFLYDETLRLDNQALGIRGALLNYQADLDGVTASLKANGHSLDIATEKGRANRTALDAVAQSALEAEAHMGKAAKVTFNNDAHDKLVDLYLRFNDNEKAAKRYADRVLGTVVPVLATAAGKLDDTTAAAKHLGEQKPTVVVGVDDQVARAGIEGFVTATNRSLDGIRDEPVSINLTASAAQTAKVLSQLGGLRDGGPAAGAIRGPGGGRDDLILAKLSNGERVNREDIVTKLGGGNNARGQSRFESIERAILRGDFDHMGDVPAFAGGGAVVVPSVSSNGLPQAVGTIDRMFAAIAGAITAGLSAKASHALSYAPTGGQLGPGGVLTPAQLLRGQQAASAQVGKPYGWGAVGPNAYDCSGFQSFTLNSAMGYANPYFRRGSTATMPWPGSAAGGGRYSIGWTPNWSGGIGHTAGNIGGLNVESYGGHGPAVGAGARGPLDPHFTGLMHYRDGGPVFRKMDTGGYLRPGPNYVWNGLGRPEEVPNPQGGSSSSDVVDAIDRLGRRLDHLTGELVRRGIKLRDPGVLAATARGVARYEDAADQSHDRRLLRMRGNG